MTDSDSQPKPSARFIVTLNRSQWSVVRYGVVEFLRSHPRWRVFVAVLGVGIVIAAAAIFAGVKLPTNLGELKISSFILLILGSSLLWMATVAGPAFELVFPENEASEERQTAEEKFEELGTPEAALNLDFSRLNEYYVINQAQARSSYRWALISMFLGFGTIVAGIWFFYFRKSEPDKFMASLSTAAGCVVNVISGLFLFLYSKTQERSLHYYEQLARLKRISLAMRLVDEHKDAEKQTEARDLVINHLLSEEKGGST